MFEGWWLFQQRLETWYAEAVRRGINDPELYPHPDDIVFDHAARSVHINGPISATEKRAWGTMLKDVDWMREKVLSWRRAVARDPLQEEPQYMLLRYTSAFLELNEALPERYKRKGLPRWGMAERLP